MLRLRHLWVSSQFLDLISQFILYHRRYSQSGYKREVVYQMIFHPTVLTVWATTFCMARYKTVVQQFFVACHEISHLSLARYMPRKYRVTHGILHGTPHDLIA